MSVGYSDSYHMLAERLEFLSPSSKDSTKTKKFCRLSLLLILIITVLSNLSKSSPNQNSHVQFCKTLVYQSYSILENIFLGLLCLMNCFTQDAVSIHCITINNSNPVLQNYQKTRAKVWKLYKYKNSC